MPDIRYDYSHVPTIRDFAQCDSFFRALAGPIGAGKSAGSTVEIARRAMAQARGPDGKRHTKWAVIRNCFDDQTEILTECRGWQLFKDLTPEDRVATLFDGKRVEFTTPSYYYAAHHNGEMVGFKSDSIDMLVTPDHRLWTSKRQTRKKIWSEFGFETANDAYGRGLRRFKADAEWQGGNTNYSVDFFEFLGFWFAEGSAGIYPRKDVKPGGQPIYNVTVTQKKDIQYARSVMEKSGFKWSEYLRPDGTIQFKLLLSDEVKRLARELASFGLQPVRRIPNWVMNAPRDHLRAFLDGYIHGDGNFRSYKLTSRAWTSSAGLADDIQALAFRAGYTSCVWKRLNKPKPSSFKASTEYSYSISFLAESRRSPVARGKWFRQQYDGMVYCLEVETHVVYVRRNGKAHWSSQTFPQLRDTTIPTFFQWMPPQYFGKYNIANHSYVIEGLPDARVEVLFRALDKPDDIANLLSLELTGAWINEMRETPWAIVDTLQSRLGRFPPQRDGGPTWFGMWGDTNMPDTDSKFYKFFEETELDPNFAKLFKQPSGLAANAENLPNLPGGREYYTRLCQGKSKEWVSVYVESNYGFVSDNKAIYPEYSDNLHLRTVEPVGSQPIIRGWDVGFGGGCVLTQMLPDGRWLIFDELEPDGVGIDRFSDQVLEHCARSFPRGARFEDYGDPAGQSRAQTDERSCFDIMQGKGIEIEPGEQTPLIRQESVRKPLRSIVNGEPQLVLHPRCKRLRKGFLGGYHYRRLQVSGERYTDKPNKNEYAGLHDALQYPATRLFSAGLTSSRFRDDYPSHQTRDERGRSSITGY